MQRVGHPHSTAVHASCLYMYVCIVMLMYVYVCIQRPTIRLEGWICGFAFAVGKHDVSSNCRSCMNACKRAATKAGADLLLWLSRVEFVMYVSHSWK